MSQDKVFTEIKSVIDDLYANNQKKLHQICNKEITRFGGLSQKDLDDFYSRAGYELSVATEAYDPERGKTFMEYAYGVIRLSVWKEMTDKNRAKRQIIIVEDTEDENGNIVKQKKYISNLSIDAPIASEENLTVGDTLQSDFNMEEEILKRLVRKDYSLKMQKYLGRLSKIQIKVLELIADEYTPEEVRKILHIDSVLYNDCISAIKSYRNTKYIASLIRRESANVG